MQKIERVREHDYASKHDLSHHVSFGLIKLRASLAISVLSDPFLERPILKLKDLLPYGLAAVHAVDMAGELAPIRDMETG